MPTGIVHGMIPLRYSAGTSCTRRTARPNARRMLAEGLQVEVIARVTRLSEEQIEAL